MDVTLGRPVLVPLPQDLPGVDARRVAVVPGEVEAPVADLPRRLDPQGDRRRLGVPRIEALLPQAPALGAEAVEPELLQGEFAHPAVVPGDGDAALALDVDGDRLGAQPTRAPST